MDLSAFVALAISLKTTKACPLIFKVFMAIMSRICPNCENIAYRDFFSSEKVESIAIHVPLDAIRKNIRKLNRKLA